MPVLDAKALDLDPKGAEFLRGVLRCVAVRAQLPVPQSRRSLVERIRSELSRPILVDLSS